MTSHPSAPWDLAEGDGDPHSGSSYPCGLSLRWAGWLRCSGESWGRGDVRKGAPGLVSSVAGGEWALQGGHPGWPAHLRAEESSMSPAVHALHMCCALHTHAWHTHCALRAHTLHRPCVPTHHTHALHTCYTLCTRTARMHCALHAHTLHSPCVPAHTHCTHALRPAHTHTAQPLCPRALHTRTAPFAGTHCTDTLLPAHTRTAHMHCTHALHTCAAQMLCALPTHTLHRLCVPVHCTHTLHACDAPCPRTQCTLPTHVMHPAHACAAHVRALHRRTLHRLGVPAHCAHALRPAHTHCTCTARSPLLLAAWLRCALQAAHPRSLQFSCGVPVLTRCPRTTARVWGPCAHCITPAESRPPSSQHRGYLRRQRPHPPGAGSW